MKKRSTLTNYANGTWYVGKEKCHVENAKINNASKNKEDSNGEKRLVAKYDSSLWCLSITVAILAAVNIFLIGTAFFARN